MTKETRHPDMRDSHITDATRATEKENRDAAFNQLADRFFDEANRKIQKPAVLSPCRPEAISALEQWLQTLRTKLDEGAWDAVEAGDPRKQFAMEVFTTTRASLPSTCCACWRSTAAARPPPPLHSAGRNASYRHRFLAFCHLNVGR